MAENGPPQTTQEPRSGSTRIKATLENRPICAVIAVRSWSLDDAQSHATLKLEKQLRPVVPLGRNRVGPLPRNRVVPFRRNQGAQSHEILHVRRSLRRSSRSALAVIHVWRTVANGISFPCSPQNGLLRHPRHRFLMESGHGATNRTPWSISNVYRISTAHNSIDRKPPFLNAFPPYPEIIEHSPRAKEKSAQRYFERQLRRSQFKSLNFCFWPGRAGRSAPKPPLGGNGAAYTRSHFWRPRAVCSIRRLAAAVGDH
jgi:hypothetical protein